MTVSVIVHFKGLHLMSLQQSYPPLLLWLPGVWCQSLWSLLTTKFFMRVLSLEHQWRLQVAWKQI